VVIATAYPADWHTATGLVEYMSVVDLMVSQSTITRPP